MTEKKDAKETLKLKAIDNGTAIDHIPAGKALQLLTALKIDLEKGTPIGMLMNVSSSKMGLKDLIFVEGLELTEKEFSKVGLIARNATINIIRNQNVVKKIKAELPEKAVGIIKCINPNCITNYEDIPTKFKIKDNPLEGKCFYCERWMSEKQLLSQIK